MDKTELGSKIAKGGFANEKAICRKFNSWRKDKEAQEWLKIMNYDIKKLDSVKAIQVPTRIKKNDLSKFEVNEKEYEQFVRFKKADAQIRIIIKIGNILKIENMSLKKANSDADYNQIDKRTVADYQEMWKFDDEITFWLKLFTGEIAHKKYSGKISIKKFRDKRRLFLNEMPERIQDKIIKFFKRNQIMIISDIIKGRGGLSADWMLVTKLIGKITMQRKGGTPDPTKIQFKTKPCQLFNLGE
ncbi:MAG: hypothetical protein BME93_00525 [Methanosarcinales archaeon Met12]|nr:MAG: hypothetical protein BME93_00525 [Methanosarcinales archaeon Met12]